MSTVSVAGETFLVSTDDIPYETNSKVTALEGGGFVISWLGYSLADNWGVFAQLYGSHGEPLGSAFRVGSTESESTSPSITSLEGGNFIVSWQCLNPVTRTLEVLAQRYGANGAPVGSAIAVSSTESPNHHDFEPSVGALKDGNFVISWAGYNPDVNTNEVLAQPYSADGVLIGSVLNVSSTEAPNYNDAQPSITALKGGGFLISWQGYKPDTFNPDIVQLEISARLYSANGAPLGSAFPVSSTEAPNYYDWDPNVTALEDGGFLISWRGYNYVPRYYDSYDVFAQRYGADGAPVGSIFPVFNGGSFEPSVTGLKGGGFVASWTNGGGQIFAQRYGADGVPVEPILTVSSPSERPNVHDDQPSVVALEDGGFVITWTGRNFIINKPEVYARRYEVSNSNSMPVAKADVGGAGTGIGGVAIGNLLINDSDPDADMLQAVAGLFTGHYGNLVLQTDGSYIYTVTDLTGPTGGHLSDRFTYSVSDGKGGSASALLDVTLNRAPIAAATQSVTVQAAKTIGGSAGISGTGVLAGFSDPDADPLAVVSVNGQTTSVGTLIAGTYGHLNLKADGSYSYDADAVPTFDPSAPRQHLHDAFSFVVGDGYGGTASSSLDVTLNRGPIAKVDLTSIKIGQTLSATVATGVLANDVDPDGDALRITSISNGTLGQAVAGKYGQLILKADGSYSYVVTAKSTDLPSSGLGEDVFTYTVSDTFASSSISSTATLSITVTGSGTQVVAGTPGTSSNLNTLTVAAGSGKQVLDGSLGYQKVVGGNGSDALIGGPGDVLTGGNGPDLFLFKGHFGHNTVTDFKPKADQIQFDKALFADFSVVKSHIVQSGADLVIDGSGGGEVVLQGIKLSSLSAGDFLFA